jgi:hypothetical protein
VEGIEGVPATQVGACPSDVVNVIKLSEIKRMNLLVFEDKAFIIVKGIDASISGLLRLPFNIIAMMFIIRAKR